MHGLELRDGPGQGFAQGVSGLDPKKGQVRPVSLLDVEDIWTRELVFFFEQGPVLEVHGARNGGRQPGKTARKN